MESLMKPVQPRAPFARPSIQRTPVPIQSWRALRPPRPIATQAAAGGGDLGGKDGGSSSSGGSGGGGSGGNGKGDDDNSSNNNPGGQPQKGGLFRGWEERVAYDPEFPIKVLMEQVIGVSACVIGDMSARPNWGLNELDFIFSTLVVGSIMNFSIMFLLAPTAGAAASAASAPLLVRLVGDYYLRAWGAPGGNCFEPGAFTVAQRLTNLVYKGTVFAVIGFFAGVAGTSLSNGLLALRKKMDPDFKLQNEPPNVVYNAFTWAVHMGVSSNLRYQILGGLDPVLVKVMPVTLFRIYQAIIRGSNNVVGGMSFATLARVLGAQKAAAA
ncbi:hypothetical protein VOLCADRAFT_81971 [Volvox carteri f. nagariensis]|uniref:Uncharacterized protein n=1 Tax=Volvox carteri f. nagariensis TaxID=3068 RepID=D8U295_VOLCA|nr:uncharacterized protein VOLCADRAFT_81971 [Volvox carteri f. nagariensis]EFJ46092.1 hypothetical protein VOLCADRAFT_81971 [Volvox carteri f. nagariensis]|eukprot:XP_002952842.1 hypothetical protein VOLCADRAFT_81971 [Volvox carteri f. nagariensis]